MINNCTFLPFLPVLQNERWWDARQMTRLTIWVSPYRYLCVGLSCSVCMCVCVPSRIVCAVCSVALPGCVSVTQCDNFLPRLFYNSHKLLLLVAPNGVCDYLCVCVFICECLWFCARLRAATKLIKSHNAYVICVGIHCYNLHTSLAI